MANPKKKKVEERPIEYGFIHKGKLYDIGSLDGKHIDEILDAIPLMSRSLSVLLGTVSKALDIAGHNQKAGDKYRDFILDDMKSAVEKVRRTETETDSKKA